MELLNTGVYKGSPQKVIYKMINARMCIQLKNIRYEKYNIIFHQRKMLRAAKINITIFNERYI